MRAWRWPIRVVLPALLVAGLVLDSRVDRGDTSAIDQQSLRSAVEISTAGALSSTWMCPAVHLSRVAERGVDGTAVLLVDNTTTDPSRARVELLSATSPPRVVEIDLPALGRRRVAIEVPDTDDLVAALVESPSGGIAVSREFTSPLGVDAAACASQPGTRWFLPAGDTQRDATNEVVVFNPLASDAVIDLSFATEAETGAFIAVDLEGLVVPPRTSIRIDLGDHVRRRDHVATVVDVRAGRVAVDQYQVYDGSAGRRGFSAGLAGDSLSERWVLPMGSVGEGRHLEVAVSNPSDEVAEVDLAAVSAGVGGDPVALTIGPREVAVIEVKEFAEFAPELPTLEVAPDLDFGIVVESANGVPVAVAVERGIGSNRAPIDDEDDPAEAESEADTPGDQGQNDAVDDGDQAGEGAAGEEAFAGAAGRALMTALPRPQSTWFLPAPVEGTSARIGLQNPGTEPRVVTVRTLNGDAVAEVTLGGSLVEVLEAPNEPLIVEADGPVGVLLMSTTDDQLGLAGTSAMGRVS